MCNLRIIFFLALMFMPYAKAWAGSQIQAPLTGGGAVHLSGTVGTSATVIIASRPNRAFLQFQNVGTNSNILDCTVDGSTPVIGTNGITLAGQSSGAGGSATYDVFVPSGALTCIGSAAATAYTVTYIP